MSLPPDSCPILPILHRYSFYSKCFQDISQILTSADFALGSYELCLDINRILQYMPVCFALSVPLPFRTLLSQLIIRAPLTNISLKFYINRFKFVCGVVSESGNYPIHEIMLMYSKDGFGCELNMIHTMIVAYPDALLHYNNNGFIPLHCLLSHINTMPNYAVLSILMHYNRATAGLSTRDNQEQMPLHLLFRHFEGDLCMESLKLLLRAYPQAMNISVTDEFIELSLNPSTNAGYAVDGEYHHIMECCSNFQ